MLDGITQLLNEMSQSSGDLWRAAVTMSALGVWSMAIVQFARDGLPVENMFHRLMWPLLYFDRGVSKRINTDASFRKGRDQIIELAAGGDEWAWCGRSAADLCTDLRAASRILVAYPRNSEVTLAMMLGAAEITNGVLGSKYAGDIRVLAAGRTANADAYDEAIRRLGLIIDRRIDVFESRLGHWWSVLLQATACVVTGVTVIVAGYAHNVGQVLLLAILGGLFAPAARDFLSALQGIRTFLEKPGSR